MSEVKLFVVPAHPGWALASPAWDGESVYCITYEPVIAWRIEIDGSASVSYPITADEAANDNCIVRRPDGTLFALYDREIEDEAAAIAWLENQEERRRQLAERRRGKA